MSSAVQLDDDRFWTIEDVEALPDDWDWRRFEIVDGLLIVSPHSVPRHDVLVAGLIRALGPIAPAGYTVMGSVMIDLRPCYRVTDMTVVSNRLFGDGVSRARPADVLLAVEVESPSSITTDRITKPAQYAAAGISHYWRLVPTPLSLHTYRLLDTAEGTYTSSGSWTEDEVATISEPFAVEIDLRQLLPQG